MMGMYAASKYAVSSLTESLRLELRNLGSNIKITVSIIYFQLTIVISFLRLYYRRKLESNENTRLEKFRKVLVDYVCDDIEWTYLHKRLGEGFIGSLEINMESFGVS